MKLYSDELMEHWENPLNWGRCKLYNVEVKQVNPLCGDEIRITAFVNERGIVEDIGFEGEQCVISRASASIYLDAIKGISVKNILNQTEVEFIKMQGMENIRPGCVLLPFTTLQKGLCQFIINTNQSL